MPSMRDTGADMSMEQFPEIEAFQKLPRRVLVKGGVSAVNKDGRAELAGIVINNLGQPVKGLKVNLIIFDEREMPVFNATTTPDPSKLSQGGMASFKFVLGSHQDKIANHYLYPSWQYDDSEWS